MYILSDDISISNHLTEYYGETKNENNGYFTGRQDIVTSQRKFYYGIQKFSSGFFFLYFSFCLLFCNVLIWCGGLLLVTMILCFPCHTKSYLYSCVFFFHSLFYNFAINVYWNINFLIFFSSFFTVLVFFVNIFCTLNRMDGGCVFCQVNNNRIGVFWTRHDVYIFGCVFLFIWDEMSFLWDFEAVWCIFLGYILSIFIQLLPIRCSVYCVLGKSIIVLSWHIISPLYLWKDDKVCLLSVYDLTYLIRNCTLSVEFIDLYV